MAVHEGIFIGFLLLTITLANSNPVIIKAAEEGPVEALYRLKKTVVPENYAIQLTLTDTFPTKPEFKGVVKITFITTEAGTDSVVLNAEEIVLDSRPILYKADDLGKTNLLQDEDPINSEELHRLTFALLTGTTLAKDIKHILEIKYTGKLFNDMYGFYLSSYKENNVDEWIATTQFQPTYARRAFPCFDEPSFKAKFDVVITHPANYRALSNTEATGTVLSVDKKSTTTTFKTTPKMSTYLLAFIVSKFTSMNSVPFDNINNAVWAQNQLIDTARYSLAIAPKILEAMETFTKIPYSQSTLSKLDQIAIPDFSAGAMENWGLVTYRESALLWDKLESTAQTKQRVATIVAHELAHMWFGNLITTDWWSASWLNEGFARYYQYYATNLVETGWELKNQFVIEQQQAILNSDAVIGASPLTSVSTDVLTRDQIANKFDSITYNKGASVIRMLEHIMGEEKFNQGIQKYTSEAENHHFGNVVPNDLWTAMSSAKDLPLPSTISLETIMETWTSLPGFPVVTVTVSDQNKVSLKAKRFLFNKPETEPDTSKWYIPITFTKSTTPDFDRTQPTSPNWIRLDQQLDLADTLAEDAWIIVNLQSTAYIRVNYDEKLWKRIQNALEKKHEDIHILNRAQIADDLLNLARANTLTYNQALDVLQYLVKETDYYAWSSAFNGFSYLRRRINSDDELGKNLNTHISKLMQALYENVSSEEGPKTQVEIYKKVLALTWACQLDNTECIENAQELFNLLKENGTPVQPDLRSVVYCTATRNAADRTNWDFLWERFTKTNMATEGTTIISALGCTKDSAILKDYIEKTITVNSGIRKQDAMSVFAAVVSNSNEGVNVGLQFLIDHHSKVSSFYGGNSPLIGVINSLADRITTKEQFDKFKTFVETAKLGTAQESAEKAVTTVDENLKWVKSISEDLLAYLIEKNVTPAPSSTTEKPGGDGATSIALSTTVFLFSIIAMLTRW